MAQQKHTASVAVSLAPENKSSTQRIEYGVITNSEIRRLHSLTVEGLGFKRQLSPRAGECSGACLLIDRASLLSRAAFPNKIREKKYERGVLVLILAVDLLTKLCQVVLQFPQFGRLPDLRCHFLC